MGDTTIKKVSSQTSPQGPMGQKYMVSGINMSMRLWEESPGPLDPVPVTRDYETLGYVIEGRAKLELEGQVVFLEKGDSWLVPKGSIHRYQIMEDFIAVETTCPPARVGDRDAR